MKQLIFLSTIFIASILMMSFSAQETYYWQSTNCFKYLKYRVIKDKHVEGKWRIHFKNDYKKDITFDVDVKGNAGTQTDSGRFTVVSGMVAKKYYFVNEAADEISFTIGRAKFNDRSWGRPYAQCDH